MSLLGIDVGTSGCKVAAFSESGRSLAAAHLEYETLHPRADWAEVDSERVWASVRQAVKTVASDTRSDPVTALCVSSMGEAMVPVSRDRRILGNSILSSDIRGGAHMDALREAIPQDRFYATNPNIIGPNYSLPKLLWLKDEDPGLFDRTDHFLLWGDLVAFMLGADATANYSLANRTLLFDIRREDWSEPLLKWAGIGREKLGRPVACGSEIGRVSDDMAGQLGLPRGVRIVAGGHDQCCNALGAGIYRAGSAVCGIGTFECITPVYDHIPEAGAMLGNGLNVEHHVLPGLYVSFVYNQGGTLVRWFRDTFAAADRMLLADGEDIYERLSGEMPVEPTDLITLPYFEMTGPPEFVSNASGVMVGLKTSTTRGDILKSIMESVTFYFVQSMSALGEMGISTTEFIATGGGARSDQWLQIKADIFGVPFVRPRITEGSLLGAAILAGAATGAFSGPAEGVERFVTRVRVFEPDTRRHGLYVERYRKYRQLFPLVREFLAG